MRARRHGYTLLGEKGGKLIKKRSLICFASNFRTRVSRVARVKTLFKFMGHLLNLMGLLILCLRLIKLLFNQEAARLMELTQS